jgi:hypothetical protein
MLIDMPNFFCNAVSVDYDDRDDNAPFHRIIWCVKITNINLSVVDLLPIKLVIACLLLSAEHIDFFVL